MLDRFERKIDYLRISVTDRCNHRCIYCMPQEGIVQKAPDQILSYEQIEQVAAVACSMGISKIRLTGGEPLVRRDIEHLVGRLAAIKGIAEVCMTTNGTLLAGLADRLKKNGLRRVNISLDALDADRYRRITRGGVLRQALTGIDAALEAGFTPVKINMVILESTTEADVRQMQLFCRRRGLILQKIMQFSLYDRDDVSSRFRTDRPPDCRGCNRLRLTADGFLKPCLFSEQEIAVDFDDIAGSLRQAVAAKPLSGRACRNRTMCQIGG